MAINNPGSINPLIPQNTVDLSNKSMTPSRAIEPAQGGAVVDNLDISKKAKILSQAIAAINQMPDIRQMEVDKAKERVIDNNGKTPAAVLAAKLLLED